MQMQNTGRFYQHKCPVYEKVNIKDSVIHLMLLLSEQVRHAW